MKKHLSMRLPEDIVEHIEGMAKAQDLSTTAAAKKMLRIAMEKGTIETSPDLDNLLSSIDEIKALVHKSTQADKGDSDGLEALSKRIERIESALAKMPKETSKVLTEVAKVGERIDALKAIQPATLQPSPAPVAAKASAAPKRKKAKKPLRLYRDRDGMVLEDKRKSSGDIPAYRERRAAPLAKTLLDDWKRLGRSERALASKLELSQNDLADLVDGRLAVDPNDNLLGRIDAIHDSIAPHVLKA